MQNFITRMLADGAELIGVNALCDFAVAPLPFRPWEVGCKILIPQDLVVLSEVINHDMDNERRLFFLVVKVHYPDGQVRWDKLYPTTLTKVAIDVKGHHHCAHGTAVDFIRQFDNWEDALHALRGKEIVVTDKDSVTVPRFGHRPETRVTSVYGFDLVGYKFALGA